MTLPELFVRSIGHPLWLAYKGETAKLKYYRNSLPLWNADQKTLRDLKSKQIRALAEHTVRTSPYYKSLFDTTGLKLSDIRSCEDIRNLPLLSKTDLNQEMPRILSTAFRKDEIVKSSTGGSSGIPMTFYRDKRATLIRRAQFHLFDAKLGIFPGTKRAWVWGSPLDVFALDSLKAKFSNFLTDRAIYYYSFDGSIESIEEFVAKWKSHCPEAIFAYPNMLTVIAEFIKDRVLTVPKVPKAVVTAEPLYDWQRQLYKDVFGAETFDRYGLREIGTIASEGFDHCGMHLFEPNFHFELIDDQGKQVSDGEWGELVVTDFWNYAMPLIRYRTGDMMRISSEPCQCGCTWRRITSIGGRAVDLIVKRDGLRIDGLAIVNALHTSGVRSKVQVVQTALDSLDVKHLVSESIPSDVQLRFQQRIDQLLGGPIRVVFVPVAQLLYDKSGKYRYVTSQCGSKDGADICNS